MTSESKEGHGDELPGFSFCLRQSRLGNEEAGNSETPMGANKKPQQKPILLNQRTKTEAEAGYQDRNLIQ